MEGSDTPPRSLIHKYNAYIVMWWRGALRAFWSLIGGDQRETGCTHVMLHVSTCGDRT